MFLSGKKDREAKGIKRCAAFSSPEATSAGRLPRAKPSTVASIT
jgi:hypothetical protein